MKGSGTEVWGELGVAVPLLGGWVGEYLGAPYALSSGCLESENENEKRVLCPPELNFVYLHWLLQYLSSPWTCALRSLLESSAGARTFVVTPVILPDSPEMATEIRRSRTKSRL